MPDRALVSKFRPYTSEELKSIARLLGSQYEQAVQELLRVLAASDVGSWRAAFTAQQLEQVNNLLAGLDNAALTWAQEQTPGLYKRGMWVAEGHLQPGGLSKYAHPGEWTPMDLGMTRIHDTAIRTLAENAALDLTEANSYCAQRIESMVARAQRMARETAGGKIPSPRLADFDYLREAAEGRLQLRIRDASLDAMQRAFARSQTPQEASRAFIGSLEDRGITSFVDRAGRQWDMRNYADMVTETVAQEAQRHGLQNRMIEMGEDTVRVSDSPEECDRCQPWEGKLLSLTGATEGLPTVDEATDDGLFHPRCSHELIPVVSGVEE